MAESDFAEASTFISKLWECFWNRWVCWYTFFFKYLFFLDGRLLVISWFSCVTSDSGTCGIKERLCWIKVASMWDCAPSWWELGRRGNLETSDPYNRSDLAREIPQQWSWRTDQPLYLLRKERPEVFWKGNRKINTCYTMLNQATRVYRALAHRDIHFEGLLISNLYLDFPSRQLLTKQLLSLSQESFSRTQSI